MERTRAWSTGRALANSGDDRLTIAFFRDPRGDLPIAPAPQLTMVSPESSAVYGQQAITFNEYRKYVRTKGARGRAQVAGVPDLPLRRRPSAVSSI
ncbi:hypothetical protein BAE44_0016580 [Dichanthelium oligosanthes]|uniref:Uncharacterized protein n=1 Tax=Dichanthelium oligosanthes TaxID=888268 RepID=A0A1E5VBC4_9POAL|nr:hypothetical protein BAE44_0016580 [Dichanthelium oligosanthes]